MCSSDLIPTERIKVRQGDADRSVTMVGNHSGGSRTMVGAGTVCHIAANKLIDAGKSLAAEGLGVEPSQVNYSKGEFSSPHSKKKITLAQLAAKKSLAGVKRKPTQPPTSLLENDLAAVR